MDSTQASVRTGNETGPGAGPVETPPSRNPVRLLTPSGVGVVLAFVATALVFYGLRPGTFSEWSTWRGILEASAVPIIVATGLTIALIVGDFDLSIGAVLGLGMGVCISLSAQHGVAWPLAVLVALGCCAAVGLVNGLLVTRAKVNSFIGTLAMGSVVAGLEAKITDQQTISQGIPEGLVTAGTRQVLGVSVGLWLAIVIAIVLLLLVRQTEAGRYLYAIGSNAEASRLAGIRVRTLRTWGFVFASLTAGLAGVLLAAQTASYYPNAGTGYLLPAYAAAFLGTALGAGRFGVFATVFGVLFLQTLQTGLTVINIAPWVVMFTQGVVLVVAVVLSQASDLVGWSRRVTRRPA